MSTAEILSLISLISYIIAGIALVLAVIFWFLFKIPAVIGDLSGRTAKKTIARKRASNEHAAGKGYQPSATNVDRGKLTDTMQHSQKLKVEVKKVQPAKVNQMPETGVLESNKVKTYEAQQTELLSSDTVTLSEETAPLQNPATMVATKPAGKALTMLDDVMLIHTDEVIG